MKWTTVLKLLRWMILIWRFDTMYKQTMNVAKGVGMGILAGVTVAAVSARTMNGGRHKKMAHMKKSAGKAVHTVGNLIGDVEKILK